MSHSIGIGPTAYDVLPAWIDAEYVCSIGIVIAGGAVRYIESRNRAVRVADEPVALVSRVRESNRLSPVSAGHIASGIDCQGNRSPQGIMLRGCGESAGRIKLRVISAGVSYKPVSKIASVDVGAGHHPRIINGA